MCLADGAGSYHAQLLQNAFLGNYNKLMYHSTYSYFLHHSGITLKINHFPLIGKCVGIGSQWSTPPVDG